MTGGDEPKQTPAEEPVGPPQSAGEDELLPHPDENLTETAEVAGDAVVESTVTQIPVTESEPPAPTDSESTQWDIDKALTVGAAVREEARHKGDMIHPDLLGNSNRVQNVTEQVHSEDPGKSTNVYRRKTELDKLQGYAKRHTDNGEEIPEDLAQEIAEAQKEFDEALAYELRMQEDRINYEKWRRDHEIGKIEKAYEKLYDLNPELFAKMSTSEFIQILPEFETVTKEAYFAEWGEEHIKEIQDQVESIIARRRILSFEREKDIASNIARALDLGNMDSKSGVYEEIYRKFDAIDQADNYDTTPHQIMQKKLQVIREYVDPIAKSREQAKKRKQEFMAKYAKKSDPEGQTQKTEDVPPTDAQIGVNRSDPAETAQRYPNMPPHLRDLIDGSAAADEEDIKEDDLHISGG